jgi:hypothetical protein
VEVKDKPMQTLTATRNTPNQQTASTMAGLASGARFLFEDEMGAEPNCF